MISGVRIYKVKISSDIEWYIYGDQSYRLVRSIISREVGLHNDISQSLFYDGLNEKFSDSFYKSIINMTNNSKNRSSISNIQNIIKSNRHQEIKKSTKLGSIHESLIKGKVINIYEAAKELFEYKLKFYQDDPDYLLNRLLYTLLPPEDLEDTENCNFYMFNNVFYCFRKIKNVITKNNLYDNKMSSIGDDIVYLKKDNVQGNVHSYVLTFDFLSVFREVASKKESSGTDILIKKSYELLHKYMGEKDLRYSNLYFDIQKNGNVEVDINGLSVDFYINIYSTYYFNNQVMFIFWVTSNIHLTVDKKDNVVYNFNHATAIAIEDDKRGLIMHVYGFYAESYDDNIINILKITKRTNYFMQYINLSEKITDYIDLKKHVRIENKMKFMENLNVV